MRYRYTNSMSKPTAKKPLYLLADSHLFFWQVSNSRFITSLRKSIGMGTSSVTKAAYIGASNGDDPVFFDLFLAAMDNIDTHISRMIRSDFPSDDRAFLTAADMIILTGGTFSEGWNIIRATGMHQIIVEKYYSGATILGISAGALQLGMGAIVPDENENFIDTLKLIPHYISTREENDDWKLLKRAMMKTGAYSKGFGIPAGGGMIYHPDHSIEPLRHGLYEFSRGAGEEGTLLGNILLPTDKDSSNQEPEQLRQLGTSNFDKTKLVNDGE